MGFSFNPPARGRLPLRLCDHPPGESGRGPHWEGGSSAHCPLGDRPQRRPRGSPTVRSAIVAGVRERDDVSTTDGGRSPATPRPSPPPRRSSTASQRPSSSRWPPRTPARHQTRRFRKPAPDEDKRPPRRHASGQTPTQTPRFRTDATDATGAAVLKRRGQRPGCRDAGRPPSSAGDSNLATDSVHGPGRGTRESTCVRFSAHPGTAADPDGVVAEKCPHPARSPSGHPHLRQRHPPRES
jgi:hypothetical protein